MSTLLAIITTADGYVCTSPADCANQGVGTYVATPARIWASIAALVALSGVAIGAGALVRARRGIGNGGRKGAVVALVAGLIAAGNGAANLAVADGGLGTGNGVAGGAIALAFGLVAAGLGWRVPARHRRTERAVHPYHRNGQT